MAKNRILHQVTLFSNSLTYSIIADKVTDGRALSGFPMSTWKRLEKYL